MKQYIYISDFSGCPDCTKKQQVLFAADAKYAYSEGYEYIQDSKGTVFYMNSDTELYECDPIITEEYLQSLTNTKSNQKSDEGDIRYHNLLMIDQIINNTLKQSDNITPQQADTMLKLAELKSMLGGV